MGGGGGGGGEGGGCLVICLTLQTTQIVPNDFGLWGRKY